MYPLTHFLVPFVLAQIFVKLGYLDYRFALIAALLGVLIDLDHYIYRIFSAKDYSFKKAWNIAVKKHDPLQRTFIHHYKGLLIFLLVKIVLLFFSWKWTIVIALGYYSHFLLDHIHIRIHKKLTFNEFGYVFRIPFYEIILDVILVLVGLLIFVN
jgi:hypothetical protein